MDLYLPRRLVDSQDREVQRGEAIKQTTSGSATSGQARVSLPSSTMTQADQRKRSKSGAVASASRRHQHHAGASRSLDFNGCYANPQKVLTIFRAYSVLLRISSAKIEPRSKGFEHGCQVTYSGCSRINCDDTQDANVNLWLMYMRLPTPQPRSLFILMEGGHAYVWMSS